MTKVTNALTSYQQVGKVEEIADVVDLTDRDETPFYSAVAKERVSNTLFQWQIDRLATSRTQPQIEGAPFARQASTQPVMLSNVTTVLSRDATVSKTALAVDVYGRSNDLDRQMILNGVDVRIDLEVQLCGAQARNDGDDDGTPSPRVTRGLEHWTPAASGGVGYAAPTNGFAAMTDGTPRPLTSAILAQAERFNYENGGRARLVLASPSQKSVISAMAPRNSAVRVDADSDTLLTGGVSVIEGDYGRLTIVPSTRIRPRTLFGLQTDKAAVAVLRPMTSTNLPDIGDAVSREVRIEAGLKVRAPHAHFKVSDLTE